MHPHTAGREFSQRVFNQFTAPEPNINLDEVPVASGPVEHLCRQSGLHMGQLESIDISGKLRVYVPDFGRTVLPARSLREVSPSDLGRLCALMFEAGDPNTPIIVGFFEEMTPPAKPAPTAPDVQAEMDGETLTFEAKKNIILRCGQSSITLTRAGKVLIQGEEILSRANLRNRLKGGSIEIN